MDPDNEQQQQQEQKPTNLHSKVKKIIIWIIVLALLTLVLVGIVLIAWAITNNSSGQTNQVCGLTRDGPPEIDVSRLRAIASHDNDTMVNCSAYVFMLDQPGGFLELPNLKQVFRSRDDNRSMSNLSLTFDCAEIVMSIQGWHQNHVYVNRLEELKLYLKQEDRPAYVCRVGNMMITTPVDKRFSCPNRQVMNCWTDSTDGRGIHYEKPVAQIVWEMLEIELDGDPGMIKTGNFSKDPMYPRCPTVD